MKLPDEVQKLMDDLWADGERRAIERIKADPKKHKLTLRYETHGGTAFKGIRWFWAGEDKRARYHYGVAEKVNAAGYILCWREVSYKKATYDRSAKRKIAGKRDQWAAKLSRSAALKLAAKRAQRHLTRLKASEA